MRVLFFCHFIRITSARKQNKKRNQKTKKTITIRAPFADSNSSNLKFCLKSHHLHKTSTIAK